MNDLTQDEVGAVVRDQFATWLEEHGWPDWPLGSKGLGSLKARLVKELCEDAFHSGWHHGRDAR